ncbi:MAG: hypothetical protein HKM05_10230 [Spirochaetales bacterium]|nr:hypothetical protein [Spirochaetales bacterium]
MKLANHWTTPAELREKLRRLWERGEIVASEDQNSVWRLPLRGPTSWELLEQFDQAREWIKHLESLEQPPGCYLEWKTTQHRQLGTNRIPTALHCKGADTVATFLNLSSELHQYRKDVRQIREAFPQLEPWTRRRASKVLENKVPWRQILAILGWLKAHPNPQIYLRQVDIAGVHTKFLESWKGLLTELATELGIGLAEGSFEQRFGFLRKPALVRLRFLNPNEGLAWQTPGGPLFRPREWTLRADDFRAFTPPVRQVLIIENEITWLALPELPQTLAIFGSGYGFDALSGATWLINLPVLYWGDLDTHGLAILDQLRLLLPQAESLLMDQETFLHHRDLWTTEPAQQTRELPRLTPAERELYEGLLMQRWGAQLRLEQERLGYSWVANRLSDRFLN